MSNYVTEPYRPDVRRVVSTDGEGKNIDGWHGYTLLAAADDRGFRDYIEHDGSRRERELHDDERYHARHGDTERETQYHANNRAANYGLPTKRILEFLLSIPQSAADLIISFSFTYDITMSLMDLPLAALCEFADLGLTIWEGYLIAGIPRKYLDVTRLIDGKRVRVWDTFAYWQMSFAKALNSSRELFSRDQQAVIKMIERMKKERSHFDTMPDDEIREYCFSECEYLSIMYRDLLKHADSMGLVQHDHFGPGSIAVAFFSKEGLKDALPQGNTLDYLSGLPASVAIRSYYGGRFEISEQGIIGDLIENDIQSAYPSIAVNLPCLRHGRFKHVKTFRPGKWGFYYVGSRTSGPWAPFPFRASAATAKEYLNYGRRHESGGKGSIAFVHGGRRWVTAAEVETARKYFGDDAVPVFDGWVFKPGCEHKPFARLIDLYLQRKIGDPECADCVTGHVPEGKTKREYFCEKHSEPSAGLSKIIKLIINSVYGKLAQAVGWKLRYDSQFGEDAAEAWDSPTYQCYIWASWITGGTRAKVLEAALIGGRDADCPECHSGEMFRACREHASVKSIATDGILTNQEIPELWTHDYALGSWERESKPDAWLGMPGIYSFKDLGKPEECEACRARGIACDDHVSDKKFKRRGLDSRYFPADHLREAWERGAWKVGPIGNPDCAECQRKRQACGDPEHGIRAFMPLRLAVTRVNTLDVIGQWIPMEKSVKFHSVEHKRNYPDDVDPFLPHPARIRLESITIPDDIQSEPFTPKQTWDSVNLGRVDDPDIPMFSLSDDEPEYGELLT